MNWLLSKDPCRQDPSRDGGTAADVDYEGSVTIPPDLLKAADIHPYESVHVWNITRGTRLETYAICGLQDSRDICANGAAAHLIRPGDRVILASYAMVARGSGSQSPPQVDLCRRGESDHPRRARTAGAAATERGRRLLIDRCRVLGLSGSRW